MGERIDISRHEAWVTDDLGNVIGIVGPTGKKNYFLTSPASIISFRAALRFARLRICSGLPW